MPNDTVIRTAGVEATGIDTGGLLRPKLVFVKFGTFSGTNGHVERMLRTFFPEFELCMIEVRDLLRKHFLRLFLALAETVMRKPIAVFKNGAVQRNLHYYAWQSPRLFEAVSGLVNEKIGKEYPDASFIFQTQAMWDSATGDIPMFIYTDSAGLTNLYYDSFPLEDLAPISWLNRESKSFAHAKAVFVWSNHVRRSLVELYHVPERKVVNVLAGSNLVSIPPSARPAPADNKTILFVGVDWHRKGGPELVEAFRRLPERHKDARLVIIGCSPKIDLEKTDLENCTIIGRVPSAEMPAHYETASIFCLPTHVEPFGIAFIEAMSYSLAAIAPNHGAMPDFITHGVTGMLHGVGDVDGILDCLVYLLDRPQERMKLAARGYEAVARTYTWDAVGRRLREEIGRFVPLKAS